MTHDNESERRFIIEGCAIPARPIPSGLHIVATPIGNLSDITVRALATLAAADIILAEDTRHSARLLHHYGIHARQLSYHEHNAARMRPRILSLLDEGKALALISDAGTPLISDPGMKLVREVLARGHAVYAIPGPSAAITALTLSGLPTDRFLFAGFPPAKSGARRRWLQELAGISATVILYESPARIRATLADIIDIFGDRPAALCRELTKLHEEVLRGRLFEIAEELHVREAIKGEITLVIAPPDEKSAPLIRENAQTHPDWREALKEALQHLPPAKAAREIARRYALPRKEVYDHAVSLQKDSDRPNPPKDG